MKPLPEFGTAPDLLVKAVVGVVKHAMAGALPPFARTLGLPQREWRELLEWCFPESAAWEWAAEAERNIPRPLRGLVEMMMAHRPPGADSRRSRWLAHAIAAACHGERHLWQDLGLAGRDEVSGLLETYFRPLAARNTQDLKWKRFLFAELGAALGKPGMRPPGCSKCDHLPICFPPGTTSGREIMARKQKPIELRGSVWMTVGGENLGGPGRIDLLSRVAEFGSITRAAKAIGMSYKAAWDAIDTMNNLAGEALVERLTGGKGGGGTRLTRRGEQLVENFRIIEREHRQFVEQLGRQARGIADDLVLIRRMKMKTSARNQFLGKVTAVKKGAVNDEIDLEILGGQKIVAIITRESTDSLGLKKGVEAFALIKASSVIVMTDDEGAKISARNRLAGTVSRVQAGAVNSEVVIELPGGGAIASIITNESADRLGLKVGTKASALFKASSVIIGVPS
ncbi:MAG: nitrogen fixation protein NifQ [Zoogloeaceae bacterium]|nr:nitrogen fixation protein NifQ [Zoogloeaceae bacterium]MCK6385376.1 nitrogen fixation protein NifQ [Rhodocyclaceae bacterium]